MPRLMSSILVALLLAGCGHVTPTGQTVPAAKLQAAAADELVSMPAGAGPHPLLVIAPAKEYPMTGPLFEALATRAAQQGWLAVRFNWGFFTRHAQPSEGLVAENAELEAVLARWTARPEVDKQHVVLAAKSFGSRVAMNGAFKQARGLLLLTPNSDAQATFARNYAPLYGQTRPVHVVISAHDPYGDLAQLYAALPHLGPQTTLDVLPDGDHNFALPGAGSEQNVDAALASSLNWLAAMRR